MPVSPENEQSTKAQSPDSKPLNFLFMANDRFPPFRVDVEVLFGKEFASRGHSIDWIMQSEEDCNRSTKVNWRGFNVFVGATDNGSRIYNRVRRHVRGLLNDLRILTIAQPGKYQFIQVKDRFLGAIAGLLAARRANVPFYYWLSYPYPEASLLAAKIGTARYPWLYRIRGHFFHALLYRLIVPKSEHVFVQSEQMKLDMIDAGVPAEKMTAVPMGVEATKEPPSASDCRPHQMIYVGTLLKTRKLDFLIRVLEQVKKTYPEANLLLVGPEELPGDMAVLSEEAKRLNLSDSVQITGRLERDEAMHLVRQSAVACSPFFPTPILNSTSPTKLVEYMAQKKAAVANDHPEQKQVLDASGGGICVPYDETKFADAVVNLMANPDKAEEMGAAGYAYVMKHRTYRALATSLEQSYQQLLEPPVPKIPT